MATEADDNGVLYGCCTIGQSNWCCVRAENLVFSGLQCLLYYMSVRKFSVPNRSVRDSTAFTTKFTDRFYMNGWVTAIACSELKLSSVGQKQLINCGKFEAIMWIRFAFTPTPCILGTSLHPDTLASRENYLLRCCNGIQNLRYYSNFVALFRNTDWEIIAVYEGQSGDSEYRSRVQGYWFSSPH